MIEVLYYFWVSYDVVPPIIVAEHAAPQLVDKRACDDVHDLMARGRRRAIGARRGRAALE